MPYFDRALKWWDGGAWRPEIDNPPPDLVAIDPGNIATTTTLTVSASTVNAGTAVTLTATVSGTPAGSVIFERLSGSTWVAISTDTASPWTASHTPTASTSYRARYLGSGVYQPSTSATKTVTVKTLQTATKEISASWSASYQQSGSKRDVSEVYQGYYSSTNGNQRGLIGFPSLGLPSGSTITKVELYVYAAHWGDSGGGTGVFGVHGYTSAPSSYTTGGIQDDVRQAWSSKTGGKWITLPSSRNSGFASGAYRGCIVGPGPSTSTLAYYGYFNGNGQSNEPKLRVTYQYYA
jgi:hypothetical protein